MRLFGKSACVVAAAAALLFSGAAQAALLIKVDQSTQRMTVAVDGNQVYEFPVSTGRPGFATPTGAFRPNRMDADHYSQEYDQAPMPYAIFFDLNGHAIHGSFDTIGRPAASHGCVRLAPANAAKLFALVQQQKMANTRVEISGDVMVAIRNAKATTKTAKAGRQPEQVVDGAYVPPQYYGRTTANTLYGLY